MKPGDQAAFQQLISSVMSYYKQDTSDFIYGLWWEACKGFELEQVQEAMRRHAIDPESGKFAPKIADIAKVLTGTHSERAQVAWGKVFNALQRFGQYQDVVFDDPVIHAVVTDMGGWPKICIVKYDDLGYVQTQFVKSYKAYANQDSFEYPKRLIGERSPDQVYEKKGLPIPKPVVVGDVEKARLVYKNGSTGKAPASLELIGELAKKIAVNS